MNILDSLEEIRHEAAKFAAHEMNFSEYLSIPYFSSTKIKRYLDNPENWEDESYFSKEKLFGSLIHKAVSEPEEFKSSKGVFLSMLSKKEREIFEKCLKKFYDKNFLAKMIKNSLYIEKVFTFDFEVKEGKKVKCKIRPDLITNKFEGGHYLVDFKTTIKDLLFFESEIKKWRYDLQMSFYKEGLKKNGFDLKGVFLCVIEKAPPFGNHLFFLSDETLSLAKIEWEKTLIEMVLCPKKSRFSEEITVI